MLRTDHRNSTPVCGYTSGCSLDHYHERHLWDEQIMTEAFGPLGQGEDNEDPESQKNSRASRIPQLRIATPSSCRGGGPFAHSECNAETLSPSSTRTEASDNIAIRVRSLRDKMYERFPEMTLEFEHFVIQDDRGRLEWLLDHSELDIQSTISEEDEEDVKDKKDEEDEQVVDCLAEDTKSTLDDTETNQGSLDSSPRDPGARRNDRKMIHIATRDSSDYDGTSPISLPRRLSEVEQERSWLSGKLESIWSRRTQSPTWSASCSNSDTSMRLSRSHKPEKPSGIWAKRWNWLSTKLKLGNPKKK